MYGPKFRAHNKPENAYYSFYKTRKPKTKKTAEPRNSSISSTAQWSPGSRPEPYLSDTHAAGLTHKHLGKEIATRGYSKTVTKFDLSPTFITREPHEHEPCPFHTFSCKQRHHSKNPGHRQTQTTQTRISHRGNWIYTIPKIYCMDH